jgi:hypothetical protein
METASIRYANPVENCVLNSYCNAAGVSAERRQMLFRAVRQIRQDGGISLTNFEQILLRPEMQEMTPLTCTSAWFVTIHGILGYSDGILLFGVRGHCLGVDCKRKTIFDPAGKGASNVSTFSSDTELAAFLQPRGGISWLGTAVLHVRLLQEDADPFHLKGAAQATARRFLNSTQPEQQVDGIGFLSLLNHYDGHFGAEEDMIVKRIVSLFTTSVNPRGDDHSVRMLEPLGGVRRVEQD